MNLQVPQRLIENYILANTPTYLFKALRNDSFVKRASQLHSKKELQAHIVEVGKKNHRDAHDIAGAYCALVALFLSDNTSNAESFDAAKASRLPWALPILAISRSAKKRNNEKELKIPRLEDSSIFDSHRKATFKEFQVDS